MISDRPMWPVTGHVRCGHTTMDREEWIMKGWLSRRVPAPWGPMIMWGNVAVWIIALIVVIGRG